MLYQHHLFFSLFIIGKLNLFLEFTDVNNSPCRIIPDSPRWLIAKGRLFEARSIIDKAALTNGKTFTTIAPVQVAGNDKDMPQINKREIWTTFKTVLKSKIMLIRALVLFYNWSANAFIYYGLSLSSVNLSGNKYLNFILVALISIPGYAIAQYTMNKLGRKPSMSGFMIICGIMCCVGAFLNGGDLPWISICLYLVGKLSITASFGIIYCYTTEMLPTVSVAIALKHFV